MYVVIRQGRLASLSRSEWVHCRSEPVPLPNKAQRSRWDYCPSGESDSSLYSFGTMRSQSKKYSRYSNPYRHLHIAALRATEEDIHQQYLSESLFSWSFPSCNLSNHEIARAKDRSGHARDGFPCGFITIVRSPPGWLSAWLCLSPLLIPKSSSEPERRLKSGRPAHGCCSHLRAA